MSPDLKSLHQKILSLSSPKRAQELMRFFKTGVGEYAEGDLFLGLSVPQQRIIAKEFNNLSLSDLSLLIKSKYHEERLTALLILVSQFSKEVPKRSAIVNIYLANTSYINNWDLVDLSAYNIIGPYLSGKNISLLIKLAHSKNLWERRIAIISTFYFIKNGTASETIEIATILINDSHDLIQKAVGWMLREIAKRVDKQITIGFLEKHAKIMPRTALRYAIEHFNVDERSHYLKLKKA